MTTDNAQKDFLCELGALGLTMRLRRIADQMVHSGRSIYREMELDIEPNWHAVLLLLDKHPGLGVAEVARRLGIRHPSASVLIDQLESRKYIRRKNDPADGRRQILLLTAHAKKKMPEFKRVWDAGSRAIQAAIDESGHDILAAVDCYEKAIKRLSFRDRVENNLKQPK